VENLEERKPCGVGKNTDREESRKRKLKRYKEGPNGGSKRNHVWLIVESSF